VGQVDLISPFIAKVLRHRAQAPLTLALLGHLRGTVVPDILFFMVAAFAIPIVGWHYSPFGMPLRMCSITLHVSACEHDTLYDPFSARQHQRPCRVFVWFA